MSRKSRKTSNVARRKSQPRKESIKAEDIKKEVAVTTNSDLETEKVKEVTTLEETVKVKEANSDNNVKEEVLEPKTEVKEELTNKKDVSIEKDAETKLEEKEIKEEAKEIIEEAKEVINEVKEVIDEVEVIDEEKEPIRYINIIGDKAIKLYSIDKNGTEYKITALLKDFAYEKDVKIKYTFDGWNTYKEEGMYYCSPDYDIEQLNDDRLQIWDKYLSIEDNEKKNFEFVLYYGVNGYNYWDNNDEKNYKIEE